MNSRLRLTRFLLIAILPLAFLIGWLMIRLSSLPSNLLTDKPSPPSQSSSTPPTLHEPNQSPHSDISNTLDDPRWIWWREMEEKDPYFEWKMPINFYG
ncbi:MAG: hypothetical protein RML49_00005, partial [Verrucomicrobiae bacterium]|nr:hypothetical protein [Verrucomicrobiae bacterium]